MADGPTDRLVAIGLESLREPPMNASGRQRLQVSTGVEAVAIAVSLAILVS